MEEMAFSALSLLVRGSNEVGGLETPILIAVHQRVKELRGLAGIQCG